MRVWSALPPSGRRFAARLYVAVRRLASRTPRACRRNARARVPDRARGVTRSPIPVRQRRPATETVGTVCGPCWKRAGGHRRGASSVPLPCASVWATDATERAGVSVCTDAHAHSSFDSVAFLPWLEPRAPAHATPQTRPPGPEPLRWQVAPGPSPRIDRIRAL